VKTWALAITLASVLFAGSRGVGADRVYLEAAGRNAQTGVARMTLCLETDKPLVCFSVKLRAVGERSDLQSAATVLNYVRLPWCDRAVSIETKGSRLTFNVADLSGESAMVTPGAGWVFALDLPLAADAAPPTIAIEEIKAFDRNGNEVRLSGGGAR
jgi:hypothetical protein